MPIDLSAYSGVFIDLDGTLYCDDHPLPGALELISRLQTRAQPFACLSNTTESPAWASRRLARMGINLDPSRIYTATAAAVDYAVETYPPRPRIFNLATSGLGDLARDRCDFAENPTDPCHAVIVGTFAGDHVTHDRMRIALTLIRNGAACVGICADRVYPSPRGLEFGSGSLSSMLAYAANVTPIFCGKPQAHFFQQACARLGLAPPDCVVIGDNLEADILGAKELGIKTILTLTGVTTAADLESIPLNRRPLHVVSTLFELL